MAIFDKNLLDDVWENLRKQDGAKRYVIKYGCKMYQKTVPDWYSDVGRFWGVSRGVRKAVPYPEIKPLDEDELREILTEQKHRAASWDVLPKYLWGFMDKT
jgi:hypothetical protein